MYERNPTVFLLLMSRFRDLNGTVELDNYKKEFKYTNEICVLLEMSGISGIRIQIRIGKRKSDITMVEVVQS